MVGMRVLVHCTGCRLQCTPLREVGCQLYSSEGVGADSAPASSLQLLGCMERVPCTADIQACVVLLTSHILQPWYWPQWSHMLFACAQDTFVGLIGKAKDLFADPSKALSAAIYTEVSDCEDELNGLFTYDRRVRMHAHLLLYESAVTQCMCSPCPGGRHIHAGQQLPKVLTPATLHVNKT